MPDVGFVAKNYSDSYLYINGGYERYLIKFLKESEEIDIKDQRFEEILHDVKRRQVTSSLFKVLSSDNVILLRSETPLPSAFKITAARDIRNNGNGRLKVFIDVSEIIKLDSKSGVYVCSGNHIDVFIAYLVSAMTYMIYYVDGKRLVNNANIFNDGMECFVNLINYLMGYLKIGVYSNNKEKLAFISSAYYQNAIMGRQNEDTIRDIAAKVSKMPDRLVDGIITSIDMDRDFLNVNTFVNFMKNYFHIEDLKIELFVDKWVYLFGSGTQFASELFPAYATMLTNTYCGVFLNNQRTIESQCGNSMVNFTAGIFKVGADSV